MNYWQRRILEEEAKAHAIALRAAAKQKAYYKKAERILRDQIAILQADILAGDSAVTRTTLWRYGKYVKLQNTINETVTRTGAQQIGLLDDAARKVFENTLEMTIEQLSAGAARFQQLGSAAVDQIVKQSWNGANYSTRVWNNTAQLADRVRRLVDETLVLGRNPQEIAAALSKEFGTSHYMADRLIRTEVAHTFNSASIITYRNAGLTQVEILVGKDERTCSSCNDIKGVYDLGQEPILPHHPNCRCCYSPVTSR